MKINYISDLHFDYKELSEINKFFKLFKKGQLYVIAGDLFNDFNKSLVLIQKLDKMGIKGY
jgi:predicted phosphodiesterase